MVTEVPQNDSTRDLQPTGELGSQAPEAPSQPDVDSLHGRFLPGTRFGKRYRIVALLGKGGMGEIYRADDLQLGQSVALKFLPKHLANDPAALARLRAEVRIARQVSHPNVCRVYDTGEVDGQYFLSMEYVDGEDLASVLRRMGRPSKAKALEIARQLCAGLAAAHECGVLHRDLKPANIMIDGRGRVRITDFGLAGFAEELRGVHEQVGTPAYMAPEQLTGREVSVRSDVYSLGLVLYELLTARRAFQADSLAELRKLHESGTLSSPSSMVEDIDPATEKVILRCLARSPADRPASALAVAAALPGGDPLAAALAAGETPSPEMVAAAGGRGGLASAIAAACLAAILAGGAAVALLNGRVALFGLSPLDKPPAVLADRAREILQKTGIAPPAGSVSYSFGVVGDYLAHIEQTDKTPGRWKRLAQAPPTAYQFAYRQSPEPLMPSNPLGRVGWTDPPPVVSGMAGVILDSQGRLVLLEIVPPEKDDSPAVAEPADFSPLFAAAGLDREDFQPARSVWNPISYADELAAWKGHYPGQPDLPIHVETAGYRGRPVYFRVVEPYRKTWRTPEPEDRTAISRGVDAVGVIVVTLMLVGAVLIARLNVRLGRGDRKGAFRLGVFAFLLAMLDWALGAEHVTRLKPEFIMLIRGLGPGLMQGIWAGLAYLALEPYVRRLWPNTLISWTRLLTGNVHDPLVGRDVLIGGVVGVAWVLLTQLALVVPGWLGLPPGAPLSPPTRVLAGAREALAQFCSCDFLLNALYCLFLLVGVLFVLRRRRVAVVAAWALLTVLATAGSMARITEASAAAEVARTAISLGLVYFVMIRFGLLAIVAAWFFRDRLLRFPITLDASAWYMETSVAVLLALAVVAAYAFRTATAGQHMLKRALLED